MLIYLSYTQCAAPAARPTSPAHFKGDFNPIAPKKQNAFYFILTNFFDYMFVACEKFDICWTNIYFSKG